MNTRTEYAMLENRGGMGRSGPQYGMVDRILGYNTEHRRVRCKFINGETGWVNMDDLRSEHLELLTAAQRKRHAQAERLIDSLKGPHAAVTGRLVSFPS